MVSAKGAKRQVTKKQMATEPDIWHVIFSGHPVQIRQGDKAALQRGKGQARQQGGHFQGAHVIQANERENPAPYFLMVMIIFNLWKVMI